MAVLKQKNIQLYPQVLSRLTVQADLAHEKQLNSARSIQLIQYIMTDHFDWFRPFVAVDFMVQKFKYRSTTAVFLLSGCIFIEGGRAGARVLLWRWYPWNCRCRSISYLPTLSTMMGAQPVLQALLCIFTHTHIYIYTVYTYIGYPRPADHICNVLFCLYM